jgi:hypothetical protein
VRLPQPSILTRWQHRQRALQACNRRCRRKRQDVGGRCFSRAQTGIKAIGFLRTTCHRFPGKFGAWRQPDPDSTDRTDGKAPCASVKAPVPLHHTYRQRPASYLHNRSLLHCCLPSRVEQGSFRKIISCVAMLSRRSHECGPVKRQNRQAKCQKRRGSPSAAAIRRTTSDMHRFLKS